MVIGLGAHRTAGHTHYGQSRENLGYMGRLCYSQNVTAVTGACLMVARDKYNKVGGFDEALPVAYNDVDFCLKLRQAGFVNVYTPYATLYHYESTTRGKDDNKRLNSDAEYMHKKWGEFLRDPYYNDNFSYIDESYSFKNSSSVL